ncbi:MAG: phosphoglycerate mutase, partial [Spirochaetes bacterium]|nr:phosphoglycerate mutase [Spirochaetota bacterium]
CVIRGKFDNLRCTPPHDITGKNTGEYLPEGEGREIVRRLMDESIDLLKSSSVNKKRIDEGKTPATQIWLWGQGYKPELPSFPDRFGLKGSVITAVDLIRGIGGLAGLDVINVDGATGFVDTNYEGKADAAIESLKDRDFVFIHVEAPDEAGHAGDVDMKIKAIEEIDIRLLKRIIENVKGDFRMLIMPDHPTPISIKTHSRSPVPFILSGTGVKPNDVNIYTEAVARKSDIFIEKGHEVINLLFKNPH